ncbi:MAG: AMP-binding protein, partial [Mariprofundaceae bacterium]
GWLHTGDIAEIDSEGYVFIIDRKKDILVLSSGENVPPSLLEQLLLHDACIEQVMVVGEAKTYLVALLVVNEVQLMRCWKKRKLPTDLNDSVEFRAWMLERMRKELHELASYMQIKKFMVVGEAWLQDTGCLTPTLKLKRQHISMLHKTEIDHLYSDFDVK